MDKQAKNHRQLLLLVFSVGLLVAPHFIYPTFLMKVLCLALFASAFNLLMGYAGLLSFGHAAFFGSGAYVMAHTTKVWGFDPLLGLISGTLVAAVTGFVIGGLAIRRLGIYFAMITFAFAQMFYFAAVQLPFTGGEDGLQNVPRGYLLGIFDLSEPLTLYYFVLLVFLAGYALIDRTVHSPFGQILMAVRENEARATSLGYRTKRLKLLAFVLSAALAGTAGGLQALVLQMASLTDVNSLKSAEVVLTTLVGGLGTLAGPIVGGIVMASIEHYLAEMGSWLTILQGCIFVFCVLIFRRGIVGAFHDALARWRLTKHVS